MKTVEVYKTNVSDQSKAEKILTEIRQELPKSDPSFDLDDCDKVLRVENPENAIDKSKVRGILKIHGFELEILP